MNELRPCAPISLKHALAQELIKGLQTVSDYLLRYNTTRMLRENESGLFLSLCRAFIEVVLLLKWADSHLASVCNDINNLCTATRTFLQVAYPHCATCFGRCYPGGAALIMDAKNLYDGVSRLLTVSSSRELRKPVSNEEGKGITENGEVPSAENGFTSVEQTGDANADEREQKNSASPSDEKSSDAWGSKFDFVGYNSFIYIFFKCKIWCW